MCYYALFNADFQSKAACVHGLFFGLGKCCSGGVWRQWYVACTERQEVLRSKLVWVLLPLVLASYVIVAGLSTMALACAVAIHSMGLWGLYRWFLR